jgi:hypothetical protein
MRIAERFEDTNHGDRRAVLWNEVRSRLLYVLGVPTLSPKNRGGDEVDDLGLFLTTCLDEQFLDAIELVFRTDSYWSVKADENALVDEINHCFELDDLPYALTSFVREWRRLEAGPFGPAGNSSVVAQYPRVIRRDSEITHALAVEPTLRLLTDPRFASANQEFLRALEDYRKADFDDCLTKCGAAFESTLKVICGMRGWPYEQKDTAAPLIQRVVTNSSLESYFTQPLTLIATLRNRESSAHGRGVERVAVARHKAEFGLNATASAILLVVQECLPELTNK